jgi:pimeloyl-ACP methyl ester carboxylesterase
MQSSSRLFPVTLSATEMAGKLYEDVYHMKPGVSSDPTVRLAVTRVRDPAWQGERFPVVLLHSEFHNRRLWLTPQGEGFAGLLARYGFDVWLPEMRSHGLSPENRDWAKGHISLLAEEDLPPVHRFVAEQSGHEPAWVGQGLGSRLLAHAMIHNDQLLQVIPGAVFIDPGSPGFHWTTRVTSFFERLNLGCHERVSGPRRGWGPEDEPSSILRDIYRSQRRYRRGKPHPIYDALRVIRCPTLSVSLNGDEEARTFAGLLGGPTRQTLVASQYEAVRSSEEGCTLVPAIQNDMRAWLDDVCRASQPEPFSRAL